MYTLEATVKSKNGIHARPSKEIVEISLKFPQTSAIIFFDKKNTKADSKSIMSLLMLEAEHGAFVRIEASGKNEKELAEKIADVINNFQI